MMQFFRKYEKVFFILITIIIVISFTFFGTYSTLRDTQYVNKTAFTAVDGTKIGRQELEEIATFLETDNEDKLVSGGVWGYNFLNDGVIKKNFLETGMAEILVKPFLDQLKPDLLTRHRREKHYKSYVHPTAEFISATNAWEVVAPEINLHLGALQKAENPADPEAFALRVKLFLAERRFPSNALHMLLRYQQQQYKWVGEDPNLNRRNLALFGYTMTGDWFGPGFIRLVAEFIINSAIIAEQRGYEVSKEEALADLFRNAEVSYQQNINYPGLGVNSVNQYFSEQLRRLGIDQTRAVNIWRKVLLFRKLFNDLGNSVLVDPFTIEQFHGYVMETIEGSLYQLPEHLRFGDYQTLKKFEAYLQAVSERPSSGVELLSLPEDFKTPEEVAENYPELVQRKYLLEISEVDKRVLQVKIPVKTTWEWEVEEKNWKQLKEMFPELGVKPGATTEERYRTLDSLDPKTRARIDSFAREQIVESKPELLKEAFDLQKPTQTVIGLRLGGGHSRFKGLKKSQGLIDLLDQYPDSKEQLDPFTADHRYYYRIQVIDQAPGLEVLTFEEAITSGIMDDILRRNEEQLEQILENLVDEIKKDYYAVNTKGSNEMIKDYAASLRFFAHMRKLRQLFGERPQMIDSLIVQENKDTAQLISAPLSDQWKLLQKPYEANRTTPNIPMGTERAFTLKEGEWSSVNTRANGDLSFFYLNEIIRGRDQIGLLEKVITTQQALSKEAQRVLMKKLVDELEKKRAFKLDFMKQDQDS